METMAATASMHFPHEPANYDKVSMHQSMVFSDSLKDLKNLSKQLYSAAEYFELSYMNDDPKHIVMKTLKDYAIMALVNTVDHLGTVSCKVNDLMDQKVDNVIGAELHLCCIEQKLRTCQNFIDREGLYQQSLAINTPKYHKRYIIPVGETEDVDSVTTKSKYQGCSLDHRDDWRHFRKAIRAAIEETPTVISEGPWPAPSPKPSKKPAGGNFSFSYTMHKHSEKRTPSPDPNRFPLLRSGSLSSKPPTPKSSIPTAATNYSQAATPNSSFARQPYISELRRSASVQVRAGKESFKDDEKNPSKSKRLLKALLSRRKSKKDDTLYTYLDEY